MSTRICPAHGGEFRKGKRVVLVDADGKPRTKLVCSSCAQRGVTVVATIVAPVVKQRVVPDARVLEAIRMLNTYLKAAEACEQAATDDDGLSGKNYQLGRIDAFETALELMKRIGKE